MPRQLRPKWHGAISPVLNRGRGGEPSRLSAVSCSTPIGGRLATVTFSKAGLILDVFICLCG